MYFYKTFALEENNSSGYMILCLQIFPVFKNTLNHFQSLLVSTMAVEKCEAGLVMFILDGLLSL